MSFRSAAALESADFDLRILRDEKKYGRGWLTELQWKYWHLEEKRDNVSWFNI